MNHYPTYLSPIETGEALRDFLWREFELSRMCFGWLPAFDTWEQKWWSSQLGYWHARNVRSLEERIRELPGSFDQTSGSPVVLRSALERISLASSNGDFWLSYQAALEALYVDYDAFLQSADPVTNSPTIDCIHHVLVERARIRTWLSASPLSAYGDETVSAGEPPWKRYVERVLQVEAARHSGIEIEWPTVPDGTPLGPVPENGRSDPSMIPSDYRSRVTTKELETYEFYVDPKNSPVANNVRQMIFINSTEIIASELVAYIFYTIHGLPLDFYYDTARHIWDEVRHTEMGLRRLKQLGFKIEDFRYWGPPHVEKTATALEHYQFYSDLTNRAEACSFSYKRACAEAFHKHGDTISAVQSEFDVADERLHTGYGTKWGPELYKVATGETLTAAQLVDKYRTESLIKKGYTEEDVANKKRALNNFCGAAEGLGKHITSVALAQY